MHLFGCPFREADARGTAYYIPEKYPELQIYNNFLTGWVRTRGQKEGQYPYGYFELLNYLFGRESNSLEVCSRYVKADGVQTGATVDINPAFNPTYCTNAETLAGVPSQKYTHVRADPPYGEEQSNSMYGVNANPNFAAMLKAMARVCEKDGLIFMLRGQNGGNQQHCKDYGLIRIGIITISVVPNQELRFLNIYTKIDHPAILEEGNHGLAAPEMVAHKVRAAGKQASLNYF